MRAALSRWDIHSDETLIGHLEECRAAGMQSDSEWKSVVWTSAVEKLAGSEVHSGGVPKDSDAIKNRFAAVRCFISHLHFHHSESLYILIS